MDLGLVGRILEVTVLLHAEALVEAIILLGGILIGLQTEVAAGNKVMAFGDYSYYWGCGGH